MTDIEMKNFVRDRDLAFVTAVLFDDWNGVRAHCRRWGVPIPKNPTVLKAGVYKAVQECRGISNDVKQLAAQKCRDLGMSPFPFGKESGK